MIVRPQAEVPVNRLSIRRSCLLASLLLAVMGWSACGGDGGTVRDVDPQGDGIGDLVTDQGPKPVEDITEPEPDPGAMDPGQVGEDVTESEYKPCLGWYGCPCEKNENCQIGFCVSSAEGKVCSGECIESSDCEAGWECREVKNSFGDPIFICIPGGVSLCQPCQENVDCSSELLQTADRCVSFGSSGNFCGTACDGPGDPECLEGYSCQNVPVVGGDSSDQCVPDDGICECSELAIQLDALTDCFVNNEWGTCWGKRECLITGLTDCSAEVPAREVCNGIDDDCDSETDNEGSDGCVEYFQDVDLDGFGLGVGHCLCDEPGPGFSTVDGDCNDVNDGVHPNSVEICNGMDDNCDDITDEENTPGCLKYSLDGDGDGWGVLGDTKCLCGPMPPYTGVIVGQQTDCDDTDKSIYPEAPEKCDLLDNDCDGITDPENSKGCEPWYYDGDEDGFGSSVKFKCLCDLQGKYNTKKSGDCDDSDPTIHPLASELCDGKDQNCNGQTDEGDPLVLCPPIGGVDLHGIVGCEGKCTMVSCDPAITPPEGGYVPGWYDNNENIADGCECQAGVEEQYEEGSCSHATDLGKFPDTGFKMLVGGNIVPSDDQDWYVVDGSDPTWKNEPNNCDLYNLKVLFTQNPGNSFVVDIYRGSCADVNNLCKEGSGFEWATNFYGDGKGECACSLAVKPGCDAPPDYEHCLAITGDANQCNGCPGTASKGVNACSDNSSLYYIKISRDSTKAPTCDSYQIEISNGLYPWSG